MGRGRTGHHGFILHSQDQDKSRWEIQLLWHLMLRKINRLVRSGYRTGSIIFNASGVIYKRYTT